MDSKLFKDLVFTEEVVERELEKWNAKQQACRKANMKTHAPAIRFLTIARDRGSLGDEIAQELSRRLGWHVFDGEIVTYIARDSHVRETMIKQLEEKSQNIIQDTISRFLKMPEKNYIGSWEYHESLIKTLAGIAKGGSAIIIGRGSNFVLRAYKEGMNIRITASPEIRIHRICESLKVTPEEARNRMSSDDEERRKFIHLYYRQDYENANYYDAVFNTDRASVECVATSILALINQPAGHPVA